MLNYKGLISGLIACVMISTVIQEAQANPSSLMIMDPAPHFYVQMENQTAQDVGISFQLNEGEAYLTPTLNNKTLLAAHQTSYSYGVIFPKLSSQDAFSIVFTSKQDCAFKVEFFAPGDPKITIAGLGCAGGGYSIDGHTLKLYISDIR
jgi:hypothetical protein